MAQLLPSSGKSRDFEIWYFAKVSVKHKTIFALEKETEQFAMTFYQCAPTEAVIRRRTNSFDEIEIPSKEAIQESILDTKLQDIVSQ